MSDVAAALRRTAARYRGCARFTRHYVASKLKRDPIHLALLALAREAPFGHVVDVGCGRGQMSVALLEAGLATSVTGLDWAGGSLADLERAGAGLAVETIARDLASDFRVPAGDTVLVIDVLYTMQRQAALGLLKAAADAARERILVRSLDAAAGWRGRFSLLIERLGAANLATFRPDGRSAPAGVPGWRVAGARFRGGDAALLGPDALCQRADGRQAEDAASARRPR